MKIQKKYVFFGIVIAILICALWWVMSIFVVDFSLKLSGTKNNQNKSLEIESIFRCSKPVTRKSSYTYVGIADNGSEYEYGFALDKSEISPSVLEKYGESWGTDSFNANRMIISFPIDDNEKISLIELPTGFWKVASDNQKQYLTDATIIYEPQDFVFVGYEYQARLSNGLFIKLPYFDLIAWSSTNDVNLKDHQDLENVSPTSFVDQVTTEIDIPEWVHNQPWIINNGPYCD